jgi:hypothetical protein
MDTSKVALVAGADPPLIQPTLVLDFTGVECYGLRRKRMALCALGFAAQMGQDGVWAALGQAVQAVYSGRFGALVG